jgi:uncharacterized glyoxalase superfamily protein PhnB
MRSFHLSEKNPATAGGTEQTDAGTLQANALMASLTVKNLEASLEWYCDIVGFDVAEKYEHAGVLRAVSLRAGSVAILIGRDDGAKGADRVKGQGFSLQLTTSQDIDEIAARIKARGGVLESDPMDTPWGARMFRLHDPDGFKFVISSERKR